MYTNIFDTHSHYLDRAFDEDREALLTSMPSLGVTRILLAGCDPEDSAGCLHLAEQFDYVWASAGVHPGCIDDLAPDWPETIRRLAESKKIRAIGEIGLDYHYDGYDAEKQKAVFIAQLELAAALDLPVILHVRDAMGDAMEILRKYRPRGVMHCYSGSAETAKELIAMGMYISFTGVLTFKNARRALEALEVIPMDRLMLETDCPYMAPVPHRSKRCDSSMIAYTAEKAAEIKGMDPQALIDQCTENGKTLFRIA
ncbi:MAG: TatD family hydrolase [Oscillospiraceae bacterium]|nr:TatD family hydrolase [Oscillospiraceae bacterium]